jgi:hypothetical protein
MRMNDEDEDETVDFDEMFEGICKATIATSHCTGVGARPTFMIIKKDVPTVVIDVSKHLEHKDRLAYTMEKTLQAIKADGYIFLTEAWQLRLDMSKPEHKKLMENYQGIGDNPEREEVVHIMLETKTFNRSRMYALKDGLIGDLLNEMDTRKPPPGHQIGGRFSGLLYKQLEQA